MDETDGGLSRILSFNRPARSGRGNPPLDTNAVLGGFPYTPHDPELDPAPLLLLLEPNPVNGYPPPSEKPALCAGAVCGTLLDLVGVVGKRQNEFERLSTAGEGGGNAGVLGRSCSGSTTGCAGVLGAPQGLP